METSAIGVPDSLATRLGEFLPGASWETFQRQVGEMGRPRLLLNVLRAPREALLAELAGAGLQVERSADWPFAWEVVGGDWRALLNLRVVLEGGVVLQEPADFLPMVLLGPAPRERFLELGAGEGQHLLLAALLMGLEGRLTAIESVRLRRDRLRENLALWRIANARTEQAPLHGYGRRAPAHYHRVLVAQLGPGDLRLGSPRHPFHRWEAGRVVEHSNALKAALLSALEATRPGGACLYAVASFLPEVCEEVVAHALRQFQGTVAAIPLRWPENLKLEALPGVTTLPGLAESFPEEVSHARRVLPQGDFRGWFVCRLRRLPRTGLASNGSKPGWDSD